MRARFKVISANSAELLEERLNRFIGSLKRETVVVDVKFSTTSAGNALMYSALVHYQETESWRD